MIRSLIRYLCEEAAPRWRSILLTSSPFAAAAIAVTASKILMVKGDCLVAHVFLNAALTYSSIAFGFSVAAITVCLALGDTRFITHMVTTSAKGHAHDTYSDLIFVFTWTAFVHILLVTSCVVGLFTFGSTDPLFHVSTEWYETGATGFVVALLCYCVMQFLITVLTLSSVGKVYILFIKGKRTPTTDRSEDKAKPKTARKRPQPTLDRDE